MKIMTDLCQVKVEVLLDYSGMFMVEFLKWLTFTKAVVFSLSFIPLPVSYANIKMVILYI